MGFSSAYGKGDVPTEENCRPLLSTVRAAVDALQRIRGFTTMRYINLRFTYLLTYLHFATPRSAVLAVVERLLLAAFSLNE